ncbi:MAG: TonB-dependent receptor, partial [Bacteroidales bacterium]|nr:TonB-dependent receptor [Bacteroidales bacterium]
ARKGTTLPAENLKPEITRSIEAGADLAFIKNRAGLDFTWYKTNTYNQLVRVPVPDPSGFAFQFINAGNIQNTGIELALRVTPIRGEFTWDIAFNYATNKSLVVELTDELDEYTIRGTSWMTTIKVVEGSQYGDVYTKGLSRNEEGRVLINEDGLPLVSDGQTMHMGNYNPDWFGGVTNTFRYKGFDLNILFDIRMGGDIFSHTEAVLAWDGISDYTLEGRDGMVVDGVLESDGGENTIEITAQDYWQHLGGRNGNTGELFRYDASFIRFRELVLGYTLNINKPSIRSLRVALVGRNLGFLYNAAEVIDPNTSVGVSNYQGVEGFGLPTTRSMGVNLKLTF